MGLTEAHVSDEWRKVDVPQREVLGPANDVVKLVSEVPVVSRYSHVGGEVHHGQVDDQSGATEPELPRRLVGLKIRVRKSEASEPTPIEAPGYDLNSIRIWSKA